MSDESKVEVGVRAQTAALDSGMKQARRIVEDSAREMRDAMERTATDTRSAMDRMRDAVKQSSSDMVRSMASVVDFRGKLIGAVTSVVTTLASGAWLRASIREAEEMADAADQLARKLGITTSEAGALRGAMGDLHVPTADFDGAIMGLNMNLRMNRERVEQMGVATRDAGGKTRNTLDIFFDGLKVLEQYREGTDRNLAAQQLFGRGARDVAVLMRLNRDVVRETYASHAEFGQLVGDENVEAMKAYRSAMNGVGDTMQGLRKVTGDALMPILTDLANWFTSKAPEAIQYVKTSMMEFVAVVRGVGFVVNAFYELVEGAFSAMVRTVAGFAEVLWKALTGDFSGAVAAAKRAFAEIQVDMKGRMAQMLKESANFSEGMQKAWKQAFEKPSGTPKGGGDTGGRQFRNPDDDDKATKSQLDAFNKLLEARRNTWDRLNELDGTMIQFGATQLAAFWKYILDNEKLTADAREAVERKYLDAAQAMRKEDTANAVLDMREQADAAGQNLRLKQELAQKEVDLLRQKFGEQSREARAAAARLAAIEREYAAQRTQLTDMAIQSEERTRLASIKLAQEQAQGEFDIGRISKEELLALEAAFEQQRFEIRRQALMQSLELVDPERDPVEYARRVEQLLEIEREYQLRRGELTRRQMTEGMEPIAVANRAFESAWSASLDGLLKRTMTWGDAIRNVFTGTVGAIVMEIGKIPARWLMNLVMDKAIKIKEVMNNAAVAASGAYAATAAIPIVGPALAPGAASLAYANVSAMAAGLSARGGYDIPAGVNPLVQTHEREMILPADIADPMREMVAGGGSPRGRGGDTYHIHAMDSRSFEQFLRRNPTALARAGREAYRDGR